MRAIALLVATASCSTTYDEESPREPADASTTTDAGAGPVDASVSEPIVDAATPDAPVAPTKPRRVFVSSERFRGDSIGGLERADQVCLELATAAKLGGAWKAWLSSSEKAAKDRLTHSAGPYVLLDGAVVALGWAELTSGKLRHGISKDEGGKSVGQDERVWTGSTADGSATATNCKGFTSAPTGTAGFAGVVDARWTSESAPACGNSNRIYCFEE